LRETPLCGSRFNAFTRARERFRDTGSPRCPLRYALAALLRVFSEVFPLAGGGSFTPARRASESPIAIACFVLRTPCSPLRTLSISARTNSPAWVLADFPARASLRARSMVLLSGMKLFSRRCSRRRSLPVARGTTGGNSRLRCPHRCRSVARRAGCARRCGQRSRALGLPCAQLFFRLKPMLEIATFRASAFNENLIRAAGNLFVGGGIGVTHVFGHSYS